MTGASSVDKILADVCAAPDARKTKGQTKRKGNQNRRITETGERVKGNENAL